MAPGTGDYDICPVCFWEDCHIQFRDESVVDGPNHVPLTEARRNFDAYGVAEGKDKDHVRSPSESEQPRYDWGGDPAGYRSAGIGLD
jgi:hypothetical protein